MENRITISICDEEYTFVAEEAPSYMQKVGSYVNDKMSQLLDAAKVGRTDAAVLTAVLLALCLMLSGCSWLDGSYVSVTPHQEQTSGGQSGAVSAANYLQLRTVLQDMVDSSTENAVINVAEYDQEQVAKGMQTAVNYLSSLYPLGAYAVDRIDYDIGVSGGKPAVSVSISYIHGRSEIRKIKTVPDMTEAEKAIAEALDACNESVVLLVRHYEREDLVQMVEDFAEQNPDIVMETPQVAEGLYPDAGTSRIVELKFTYQTSRDSDAGSGRTAVRRGHAVCKRRRLGQPEV